MIRLIIDRIVGPIRVWWFLANAVKTKRHKGYMIEIRRVHRLLPMWRWTVLDRVGREVATDFGLSKAECEEAAVEAVESHRLRMTAFFN